MVSSAPQQPGSCNIQTMKLETRQHNTMPLQSLQTCTRCSDCRYANVITVKIARVSLPEQGDSFYDSFFYFYSQDEEIFSVLCTTTVTLDTRLTPFFSQTPPAFLRSPVQARPRVPPSKSLQVNMQARQNASQSSSAMEVVRDMQMNRYGLCM